MKNTPFLLIVFLAPLLVCHPRPAAAANVQDGQAEPTAGVSAEHPPLVQGLLTLKFPITTKSGLAQQYFDQGMVLAYGFDHEDAKQSFLTAARLDPECAMCYWGAALVLGPNINAPMTDAAAAEAYGFLQKAIQLAANLTEKEKALIRALAKRYAPAPAEDRTALDRAFADAMGQVAQAYPDDPEIGVLYVEALMDLHPWDYWTPDGKPQPWTPDIQGLLETLLASHPRHPQLHHLYIHLLENSPFPEKTIKSADIIAELAPASGHLVHMAGHAYFAVGLYHDCSTINERALEVDRTLQNSFPAQGLYHLLYIPHVQQFLWFSYSREGRSAEALKTGRDLARRVEEEMAGDPGSGTLQHYWTIQYYGLARFGKWDEILAEPRPDERLRYPTGVWHYMRGLAFTRKGRFPEAGKELETLRQIAVDPSLAGIKIWDLNKVADLLNIGAHVLAGELAAAQKQYDKAVDYLEKGLALEEKLPFDEPPPWYYPVRQALGAVFLDMGRPADAEAVYRSDLRLNAENGWSLFGLAESLRAQGKNELAEDADRRFRRAWARADIELSGSRF